MSNARSAVFTVGVRAGAVGSLASAAGLLVVAGASSAGAAAACPVGATQVAPGVCSVTLTSSGSFTAPAGVTTLEALLVGGGGAGSDGCSEYTGGAAGEATYVSTVSTAGPVSVTVGNGGVAPLGFECNDRDPAVVDGADTVMTDAASTVSTATGGAYMGGVGGTGVLPSTFVAGVPGTIALWPVFVGEACFGDDGMDGELSSGASDDPNNFSGTTQRQPCGGGALSDLTPDVFVGGGEFADGVAGTGSGGAAFSYFALDVDDTNLDYESIQGDGGSGFVTFRYPMSQVREGVQGGGQMADTGATTAGFGWASAALTVLGLAFVGASKRVRRSSTV